MKANLLNEITRALPRISAVELEGPSIVLYAEPADYSKKISELTRKLAKRFIVRSPRTRRRPVAEALEALAADGVSAVAAVNEEYGEIFVLSDNPRRTRRLGWKIFAETGWRLRILRKPRVRELPGSMLRVNAVRAAPERYKYLREAAYRYVFKDRRGDLGEYLRIVFVGGVGGIGRSAIVVEAPDAKILLDYGGDPRDPLLRPRLELADIRLEDIDAVILSHAHLDHAAMLPSLAVKSKAPIYVAEATHYLFTLELSDYIRVAQRRGVKPPFTDMAIDVAVQHMITQPPGLRLEILPDVYLTFHRAGHILGSAMTYLEVDGRTILYTGDVRYADTGIHKSMRKLPRADVLIIESTYGGKRHVPRREAYEEIRRILRRHVAGRRGVVLFPALTVGRAQEILWLVWKTVREERLPVPHIFLDGLAREATAIYTAYPEELAVPVEELAEALDYTESPPPRERGDRLEPGTVIIAGHGMLQGGPALDYLKYVAGSEDNAVVLTSYQAPGTLGAELAAGKRSIAVNGRVVAVAAQVYVVEGLSAHADQPKLLEIALRVKPKIVFVVHGENGSTRALVKALRELGFEALAPRPLEARTVYAKI